jgi:pimeloyl-ACP methyl ester carboxylesterase
MPAVDTSSVRSYQRIQLDLTHASLIGDLRAGKGPTVVLLHPGVADRRCWSSVVGSLDAARSVLVYDRPGFGETSPPTAPFTHVADLLAVVNEFAAPPVWLVGNSAGGGIALDAALIAPELFVGLVLIAPGISGAPEPTLDAGTQRLAERLQAAADAGDLDEVNRLETWLWLDGPGQPEGRVGGSARSLELEMNGLILKNAVPEGAGASGVDAWNRLGELTLPVTVACGEFDVPCLVDRSRELVQRLPNATHRLLPGTAHLPQLEQPHEVADLVQSALAADRAERRY